MTVAQSQNLRPFVVRVSPLHLQNWRWEQSEAGARLVEVHIREDRYEQIGDELYLVECCRVITPDEIVAFSRTGEGEAAPGEPYTNGFGEIVRGHWRVTVPLLHRLSRRRISPRSTLRRRVYAATHLVLDRVLPLLGA